MEETIDKAIKVLAKVTEGTRDANEALKFSQAALNLAHVRATLLDVKLRS